MPCTCARCPCCCPPPLSAPRAACGGSPAAGSDPVPAISQIHFRRVPPGYALATSICVHQSPVSWALRDTSESRPPGLRARSACGRRPTCATGRSCPRRTRSWSWRTRCWTRGAAPARAAWAWGSLRDGGSARAGRAGRACCVLCCRGQALCMLCLSCRVRRCTAAEAQPPPL